MFSEVISRIQFHKPGSSSKHFVPLPTVVNLCTIDTEISTIQQRGEVFHLKSCEGQYEVKWRFLWEISPASVEENVSEVVSMP